MDGESTLSPVDEAATLEEVAAEEASEASAPEDGDAGLCEADSTTPVASGTAETFRRWLRDQSVGRQISVEGVHSSCGDRDGFLVMRLTLSGSADGLLSLGRALEAYYRGASWSPLSHERLGASPLRLRIEVDALIPLGTTPLPRCSWDPSTPCPK